MFERIKGELEEINVDSVIIGTSSFSYKIFVSLRTIQNLPNLESNLILYLHPIFKDTDITLYGFDNVEDREIFKDLLSVSKVGPKTAISLLSLYDKNQIIHYITSGRVKELTRATGLGKKGAEMIIASLKDRYKNYKIDETAISEGGVTELIRTNDQIFNDAIAALTGLGYSWEVASDAIRRSYKDNIILEDLIRDALINMNG